MKLRTRILVAVLACIAAVCGLSQVVQHQRADALMERLSTDNLARTEQTQWTWLGNLQHACETSLVDTMARGEMDRFQQLLDEQREVRGVRELSLADREGRIAFSSDPARVGARLPDALRREVAASTDSIHRRVDGDFEIHTPLAVSPGCLDCHSDMQGAPIAGVLSYRFSGEALEEARTAWAGFVARLQDSLLGNAIASGLAMIGLVGLVMSWCIHTLVAKPLERVGGALQTGSAEVGAAAAAIAAASEEQAEGATRQAAALEETSASIEEISSMTRTNASHAAEARQLAGEARHAAEAGVEAMARMQATMREIEASNANVRAILKTIDEIAFQTNILALNAAVEAARAGEAGMGFGVVAEEVRNLAQRSAEAARSTATKISDAMQKVQAGSRITAEVSRQLETIVLKVRAEDEVSARIAAASVEQARAIEQITSAMNEVDGVTRHAASGAEETAGAAEELNGQVGTLRDSVGELLALVHGSPRRSDASHPQPAHERSEPWAPQPALRASSEAWTHRASHLPASPNNRATRSPGVARSGESSR